MINKIRKFVFIIAALGFSLIFLWGMGGLPAYGRYDGVYGKTLNSVEVSQRHANNVVSAVAFDYRGFDTLCEEFILFAAVTGSALLLRKKPEESEQPPDEDIPGRKVPETSDAVRLLGHGLVGFTFLFGIYMVIHAALSPGGGFQGGVVLASAILLIYLAYDYLTFHRVSPISLIQLAESAGTGGFILIGLAGMFNGGAFLLNFLPLGQRGALQSAGTILLTNIAAGFAVAAGILLLLTDFLEQTLILREGKWWR
jgi:multicomponent Na+:H+ antiporter subunit B